MIATRHARTRQQALLEARQRHATARVAPDSRGPRPPIGRRTGPFLVLFMAMAALVLLGLVMALSATAAPSLSGTNSAWSLFKSQAMWLGVGTVAVLVLLRVDYRRWRRFAVAGMGASLLLLALTADAQRRPQRQWSPAMARGGIGRVPAVRGGEARFRRVRC